MRERTYAKKPAAKAAPSPSPIVGQSPPYPVQAELAEGVDGLEAQVRRAERLGHHFERLPPGGDAPRSGGGRPVPGPVRQKMEASLGADFSTVRVHEGPQASKIGARAFTRGNDVYFAPGRYAPESREGQRLLGHELTHIVQQRTGRVAAPQGEGTPINADPALEREADAGGRSAAEGKQAAVAGGATLSPAAVAPVQCVFEVPEEERARPEQFMKARARLAARLMGASVGELRDEVDQGRTLVNQWNSTEGNPVTQEQADTLHAKTVAKDYTEVKRFQSEASHYKPRAASGFSGYQQVRELHGAQYLDASDVAAYPYSPLQHSGTAYLGARHTHGENNSPFVSLAKQPEKLLDSADTGEKGAQTIAQKAAQLHTYTVPKQFTWTPQRMIEAMESEPGLPDESIGNSDQTAREWLSGTPTQESEVLYLGDDLDKYRTKQEANPNLPKKGKKKKRS